MNTGTSVLWSMRGFRFRSRPHQEGRERNGKHLGGLLSSSPLDLPPGGQVDGGAVGTRLSVGLPERLRVACAPLWWPFCPLAGARRAGYAPVAGTDLSAIMPPQAQAANLPP